MRTKKEVFVDEHRFNWKIYLWEKDDWQLMESMIVGDDFIYNWNGPGHETYSLTRGKTETPKPLASYYVEAKWVQPPVWDQYMKGHEDYTVTEEGEESVRGFSCCKYKVERPLDGLYIYIYVDTKGLMRRLETHLNQGGGWESHTTDYLKIKINPRFSEKDFKPIPGYKIVESEY